MSSVVCNQGYCKYRKAVFCGRDYVMLNNFGQCNVWFDRNGAPRPQPFYDIEEKSSEITKEKDEDSCGNGEN